jgi:hypothetical protein
LSCIPRAVIEYHIKTWSNLRKPQVHSLKAIK